MSMYPRCSALYQKKVTAGAFSKERIIRLTREFGERVVLLGGLTRDRIEQIRKSIKDDFSVAGITLFFGCSKNDG